jgi:poly-gamma-glutamate capsule biosynthesis protein CapA/YwtB (metallophosphatase superfamily)
VAVLAVGAALVAGCTDSTVEAPAAPAPTAATPGAGPTTSLSSERFSLVATGDVLLHPALWAQAEKDGRDGEPDFSPMLADVKPVIKGADLALCHLETPLAEPGGPFSGYPRFSGPPQIVPALRKAGYDACSTASNHTFDQGAAGIERTLNALDENGIAHTGSARTKAESEKITMVEANGVKVALLSYSFGWNGVSYPNGQTWRGNLIDEAEMEAAATRAREQGAEAVVLSVHWGTEYSPEPSAQQRALAPKLARSNRFDVIISHHAHVVEPVEKIGRTWVVYGLGNFVAHHSTPQPANEEGLLVRFTFEKQPGRKRFTTTKAEYLPLYVTRTAPIRVLDVPKALARKDYGSTTEQRLETAEQRTEGVVRTKGLALIE